MLDEEIEKRKKNTDDDIRNTTFKVPINFKKDEDIRSTSIKVPTNFTIKYYYPIFLNIFKDRKEFVSTYGRDINIWNEFENGKIHGLNDKNILVFTKNWVKSKIMSEILWFNNTYKGFYYEKYVPFIERMKGYCREYFEKGRAIKFFKWFLNVYLPSEIFP